MAGDTVDIRIRAADAQAVAAFRRLKQEATHSLGSLAALATSAVPVMATLGVASVKTAGTAVGAAGAMTAFGLAVAGQIPHLSNAAEAQKKYREAVQQNGRGSKEAAEAQLKLSNTLASMPAATARAAVGLRTMKDGFREWSDSTATFTMAPVEKTFTVLDQIFPRLTPMVKGASEQLDRLVTVAGGAVASPGFDAFSERIATFTTSSMDKAIDGLLHLSRALSEGEASGPIKAFMDYAEKNGPAVEESLSALGGAVTTLATAAADAGPGMLTLVTAAAELVAALPPELVTVLMQTAVALKLVTLAGAGAAAASTAVAALGTRIGVMRGAAIAAGGGLASLRAAFLALGVASRASIVVAAIAGVTVAFSKLGNIGREAPPNVDKLTTSLGQLGIKGKASGEAARLFGKDLDGLFESVRNITDPSTADNVQNSLVKIFSLGFADSTPWKEARKRLDSVDEGLANLVKGGKADVAAAAFKRLSDEYVAGGGKLSDFTGQMDNYNSALADVKFEEDLAADAMGVFGEAARNTSATLEAQKGAADGLRASILALNEVNRSAYDAQIGFEESLDKLTASFKKHGDTLNLDTEAGRANGQAMSEAAKAQDEFIASGLAAGESLGSMTKKSEELRETMMRLATDAFDGNKAKATEYVNTLLGAPGEIATIVKLEREEAITGLEEVRAAIRDTPDAHKVTVSTLNGAAIAALEAVGLKTKQLPDGKTAVFTANGQALGSIGAVSTALNNLDGNTANTYVNTTYTKTYRTFRQGERDFMNKSASGGLLRKYADGGALQHFPNGGYIQGPGGPRTDSILATFASGATAAVSDTEFVVQASAVQKYGVAFLEALNEGSLKVQKLARGGVTKSERQARKDARGDLTVSYYGQRAGYKNTEFANDLGSADSMKDLVSSLNKWRNIIKKATHGGVEENLLKRLNSAGKALMKYEKQHDALSKALEKAKSLRDSVASGLRGEAGIVKAATASTSQVTINTLLSEMTGSAANTKQFSSMLTQLRKRGVSKDIIKQIAEAGIDGGGMETAAAILGGGKGEIKRLNELQKQIGSSAKSAGNAAADAMYGAGMKAGDGIIAGLEKKQKAIEKQMMKIAKAMEKSIKKALGIKSPSKVMEEVGDYTAEGFALGMRKNRSVTPAWASMLNQPATMPARTAPAGGGTAGERPIVLNVSLAGRDFGQIWVDVGRKEVSTRGGLTATLGGS